MSVDDGIAGIVDAVEDLGLENRTYVRLRCHLPLAEKLHSRLHSNSSARSIQCTMVLE